ncbi:tetratricopeptide repeat protein [Fabibacter sp. E12]|nr:tetratricopeptide repeat protein [Roseivirga sp. E12]
MAQSNDVDSLKTEFKRTRNPETGLELILSLLNSEKDSARLYLDQIDQNQLDSDQFIKFQLYKGYNYRLATEYDSAIRVYIDLLPIISESGQPIKEADINDRIADIYIQLREVDQATSYFNQAITIREENGLTSELAKSYYALGSLQFRSGDTKEAVKNYKKGIESIEGDNQIALLANLNYMLGNSYNVLPRIDSARQYFENAKQLYDQIGPDQMKIAVSNELVKILIIQKKMDLAIPILEENLVTIQAFNDWQHYNRIYSLLVEAHKGLGNYEKALFYMQSKYDTVVNFLANQQTQSVAKITEDYRTDKQLDEAEEQAFFATRRAKIFGVVIIIMIIVLIIAYLLFSRAIQKKKLENLQAMVLGEENERKRVAKDLHDGIGVLLTSVKLRLTNFQDKVEAKEDFKNSLEQIDNACTEVRRISHNMIPASLTKLGLQEAILDLLDNVQASTDILIEEALNYEEGAYDESKEVLIYRVVQELINNSLKYADPTKLSIELAKSKQDYILTYKDDGKGFEKSKVKSGLGLRSIASRVDILKGKLTFETSPGQGAIFNITIPHYG